MKTRCDNFVIVCGRPVLKFTAICVTGIWRRFTNALAHRLRKQGWQVEQQFSLPVYDEDGTLLGNFFADLFVAGCLIVELKACKSLADEHMAQLFGYLRASRIEHGMLINSGASRLQVRKYVLND